MRYLLRFVPVLGLLAALGAGSSSVTAEPAAVIVRVTTGSGKAIAGVRVSARFEPEGNPDFLTPKLAASGETDTAGAVRLVGLDPKTGYTLVATPPDVRWHEFSDRCVTDWAPQDTTLFLGKASTLKGVVHDSGGKPIPHAVVYAAVETWRSSRIADHRGAFIFVNAPAGDASVWAAVAQRGTDALEGTRKQVSTGGRSVTLKVDSAAAKRQKLLIVRLLTPAGRPIMYAGATFGGRRNIVGKKRTRTRSFSTGADVQGGAALTSRFKMAMKLEVIGARSEYGERLACGPGRGGPYGPGPQEHTLRLPVESLIEGRVLGPDKQPLTGIRVRAYKTSSSGFFWAGSHHGECVTGAGGQFRLGGLESRRYELRPQSTPDYVGGCGGKFEAGATGAELVMRAAVSPTFLVRDEDETPIENALVRVKPLVLDEHFENPEDHLEAESDEKGRLRIPGLDPEIRYILTATPSTARLDLLALKIDRWVPRDMTLTLERAQQITGIVKDQAGEPVPAARVRATRVAHDEKEPVNPVSVKAGPDGKFLLEKLRPGKYELLARPPIVPRKGADSAAPVDQKSLKPKVVHAGKGDVSLELKMPEEITVRVLAWDKALGKPDVLLTAEGPRGSGPSSVKKKLNKRGEVIFKGLRWNETYTLWMGSLKNGKYVYRAGLRPQARKIGLKAEDGKTAAGKIVFPKGMKSRKVWAEIAGFKVTGKIKGGSRFEIKGLPPGPWTIRVCGKQGKEIVETEAICKPGEETVITFGGK